ncbi:hypothetical protein OF83DRAFT_1056493 [Amylostereum chailletii]|nr:hypothetical protein OF83DRAFT_1056493 [Amylostereum chailletii]
MLSARPAHETKHISLLPYPFLSSSFSLLQLDDGRSNGTALWLGAQCLSLFLVQLYSRPKSVSTARPRALELGSGIGLSALALASIGWDVLATDTTHVISSTLSNNVTTNSAHLPLLSGDIQVRELDWTVPPDNWNWQHPVSIASHSFPLTPEDTATSALRPPFDLIISSDTLYTSQLVQPLFRTLHAAASRSLTPSGRSVPVYLCIERRDSDLIDKALADAQHIWGFSVDRIPHRKVVKAMEKGGLKWSPDQWDGVEIWKLQLKKTTA